MFRMRVLLDLLMATMDSMSAWSSAAGDRALGLAWRDAVTDRMIEAGEYVPYEGLVTDAGAALDLPPDAPERLWRAWREMRPWPDAGAVARLGVPYAFVTNCSAELAAIAAERSGLQPAFMLSAEEAGWFKPRPEIYRLACDRIGAAPASVRFVAGAAYDAIGASDAGVRAVLVARRPLDAVLPATIAVVASLDEALAGG
jgi:2-haloalkanoic acid dehalogenase type II